MQNSLYFLRLYLPDYPACRECSSGRRQSGPRGRGGILTSKTGVLYEMRFPAMAHDVFISYSSRDKEIADMVCDALEKQRAQCWIAPRDIVPGMDWSDAIVECKVFLLVLSKASNESEQVKREVQNAVSERKHIFTFLIEQVDLTKHMRYFIGTPHWMDALM